MQLRSLVLSILLTGSCLSSAPTAFAAPQCQNIFENQANSPFVVTGEWRKTSGSFFSAVRANAPHNWAYFKSIQQKLVFLKEVFQVEGTGVGDFHVLNIGDIELVNGSRKIGLIDVDDGGKTSLFADFTRAAISNQASPYKVSLKDLWAEYLSGLLNNNNKKPKIVREILRQTHEDFLAQQKNYLSKMIDREKFSDQAGLRPLSEADKLTQDIYLKSIGAFHLILGKVEVLDQGYKIKETGGSQGIPRFWFLIKKNGAKSIIEFKTLAEPAMNLYRKQGSQKDRINELIEIYRPQKATHGLYQFVDGGAYKFIARERIKPFLNLSPEEQVDTFDTQDGQNIYLYLAHRAGTWHFQQGQGQKLYLALTKQEHESFKEFESLVKNYLKIMRQENKL